MKLRATHKYYETGAEIPRADNIVRFIQVEGEAMPTHKARIILDSRLIGLKRTPRVIIRSSAQELSCGGRPG